DGLPINGGPIQPPQVNNFSIDFAVRIRYVNGWLHHVEIGEDSNIGTFAGHPSNTNGETIIELVDVHRLLFQIEIDMLHNQNRIFEVQGGIHQADIVLSARWRHDTPSRRSCKNSRWIHRMLRTITPSSGDFGTSNDGHRGLPTVHVS